MIKAAIVGLGRIALLLAGAAFLTAMSLLVLGSFMLTYPITRTSPRQQKIAAATQLASAGLAFLQTFATRE